MPTLDQLNPILQSGQATTEAALELFDALGPVSLEFMIGRWRGSELSTHHPMDGLLAASNWYGKEFLDPETVHPLLFLDGQNRVFKVAPSLAAMRLSLKLPMFKQPAFHPLVRLMTAMSTTQASQARLRMMEYRHQVSATMIYDNLPINDSFRKVDDNTVLGLMDFKDIPQPFFFVLRRE
ncbi:MAG: hypothetical protein DCF32_19235 [Leptolyngbya sp.]|nr:MAG: hypothetical protein DCF32_19235 [Leptolyngbya sp.]